MQGRLDRHCLLLNSYKHLSDPPIALGTPTLRPSASNRSRSAGSLTNFKIRFRSEATATTFYFKFFEKKSILLFLNVEAWETCSYWIILTVAVCILVSKFDIPPRMSSACQGI